MLKQWKERLRLLSIMDGLVPRRLWLGGALLACLTVLMGMALLGLSGWFITATALAGLLPAVAQMFDVFMPSAGIRLLAVGRTGARYAERLVTHDATLAALASLRVKLFSHWAGSSRTARALLLRPARLLQRLTADVDALDSLYLRLLVPAMAAMGAALMLGLAMGLMRWWLGVAAALWLLVAGWGIELWLGRSTIGPAVRRALRIERLRAQSVDLVAGQTELLLAGRLPAQMRAIARSDARAAQSDEALFRAEARAAAAYGMAGTMTLAAALLALGWLVQEENIGAAVAAMGLLLALSAMEPFAALRRGAAEAGRTWLALRRTAACGQPAPRPVLRKPRIGHAVQLSHAVLAAGGAPGRDSRLLGPFDLEIRAGERVALMGASGAGKSSLLQLIAGELPVLSGEVAALRCSWLTQRTELFQDTVRGNLQLARAGQAPASDDELWSALEAAGLATDIRALPKGLETALGEGGQGLSGGQARRLALARLLLSDASCWLLDEPTEGLDAATAADVLQRLALAASGRTLVIATHLQREAGLAQRLLHLHAGRVAEQLTSGNAAYGLRLAGLRSDEWLEDEPDLPSRKKGRAQAATDFEANHGERTPS